MMKKFLILLVVLTAVLTTAWWTYPKETQRQSFYPEPSLLKHITPHVGSEAIYAKARDLSYRLEGLLRDPKLGMHEDVINKTLSVLKCTQDNPARNHTILTVIDYSLPSNQKRLWIFNLETQRLLFHTYVSHGINSGARISNHFSNKNNSRESSIGVYATERAYRGREGLSLALQGLDPGFNDNAASRAIVMHGGWYVEEAFIRKYGRAGRSWGCPALPEHLSSSIINAIKDNSLLVVYYPNDQWFAKSRFLKCESSKTLPAPLPGEEVTSARETVLLANMYKNLEPLVVAMEASEYAARFHTSPPLERMLRRQVNHHEYIALSQQEFQQLISVSPDGALSHVEIVKPVVLMERGYAVTKMELAPFGKIKTVVLNHHEGSQRGDHYTVYFEGGAPLSLQPSDKFIRWLGL